MSNRLLRCLVLILGLISGTAQAQIFNSYPFILQNGTTADASQVMADFNQIANQVNANAANSPTNTNIGTLGALGNGSAGTPSVAWLNFNTSGFWYDTTNGCIATTFGAAEVECINGTGIHLLPVQTNPGLQDAATVGYVNSQVGSLSVAGRLTLATGTPVMANTVTAATSVFFTPYLGNAMVYSNGANIGVTTFTELSQALSDTTLSPAAAIANSLYDMFFWFFTSTTFTGVTSTGFPQITSIAGISGGTASLIVGGTVVGSCIPGGSTIISINSPTQITINNNATCNGSATFATNESANKTFVISRGPKWTNTTTRGYTLSRLNGFVVNTSSIANGPGALAGIYLGTIRTDVGGATVTWQFGSSGVDPAEAASFDVWNMYNRVEVNTMVGDSSASWAYSTAVWREAHGDVGMQVSWTTGLVEDPIRATYTDLLANSSTSCTSDVAVGLNTASAPSGVLAAFGGGTGNAGAFNTISGVLSTYVGVGQNAVAALENVSCGTGTFEGGGSGGMSFGTRM